MINVLCMQVTFSKDGNYLYTGGRKVICIAILLTCLCRFRILNQEKYRSVHVNEAGLTIARVAHGPGQPGPNLSTAQIGLDLGSIFWLIACGRD